MPASQPANQPAPEAAAPAPVRGSLPPAWTTSPPRPASAGRSCTATSTPRPTCTARSWTAPARGWPTPSAPATSPRPASTRWSGPPPPTPTGFGCCSTTPPESRSSAPRWTASTPPWSASPAASSPRGSPTPPGRRGPHGWPPRSRSKRSWRGWTPASPTASRPPNGSAWPWTASSAPPNRSPDDHAQPPPRGAERLLHLLVRGGFGEHKAQVAVTLRERTDGLAYRDGDRQAGGARDGRGLGPAVHGLEHARAFHRQHQHASGPGQAVGCHAAAQGVGEHQLLQADAVQEAQRARAQANDGAGRHLQHGRLLLAAMSVQSQLGVDG